MQIDTLLPHCRYMPATWLTDTVRQLLTAYTQHTNFRLYFKQMLLVIDEHSDVDGRHVFDQDNKEWKAVSNALKGLVIDDDDQYHLSVHMMSSRSAENVCHISLVLPESAEEFFKFHQKGIAYSPLEPSVMVNFSLVSEASSVPAICYGLERQKVLINQWVSMCRPITSREKSCHLRKPITRGRKNRRVCRNCDCAGTGARTVSVNRRKGRVGKLHDAELS